VSAEQIATPRHVLRTIPSYFPYVTGPANQAREISRGLRPLGFDSTILTTNLSAAAAPPREMLDGVEVRRLPIRLGFMQYHVAPGAWGELRRRPVDIIHAHSYRNFLADAAGLAAHRRRVPLILQLHGCLVGYRQIVRGGRRWLYRAYDAMTRPLPTLRADRIIVSTSAEAREAEGFGLDSRRISVIPMGIDPERYHCADTPREPSKITFVGRLAEDRNVEQLLRSLALVADLRWSCAIVGGEERRTYTSAFGYLACLKQLVRDLGIAERVVFTGPLYGEELRRAYASAGIFVYTSRYENFGQAILEAAAAGCALVTTGVGVANDIVRDGATGFVIEQDAPEQLAGKLRWLLEHPAEQAAMGRKAQALVRRDYAWSPILQRYADLYADAIDERKARQLRPAGAVRSGRL
jgi:glycosyltransferase involved in cell wall biosynthesis